MSESTVDLEPHVKTSERIRRARRKADLSQSALAERLKVQRSAVSNWESANDIHPSLQNLIALAKVCEVSFEWLATGRGRMSVDDELVDIPTADAELIDQREERELLAIYRSLPHTKQRLVVEVLRVFLAPRQR